MRVKAQILHINAPAKHSQTRPGTLSQLLFRTVSARQGPFPGHVFSFSNKTKNPLPVLAIPGSFIELPGSLHQEKYGRKPSFLILYLWLCFYQKRENVTQTPW